MKKLVMILPACLLAISTFAQEGTIQKSFWGDPLSHPMLPVYAVTTFVFIVLILVLAVALYLIKIVNMMTEQIKKEKAERLGKSYVPEPTLWKKFIQRLSDSVPVEKEKDIVLDHNYDGIRELDNHLPPWWKWLFYGTIGWSVVYLIIYHVTDTLPLSEQEYQNEVALAEEQMAKLRSAQPVAEIDVETLQFSDDASIIEHGKKVFTDNNCGSCHRNDGGGNTIGPNLTDEYWLHGHDIKSIFNTINDGVVEKGMPAWGKVMSQQDVRDVTFFVMSLLGSNPPDAKGPQGELLKLPEEARSDTTQTQATL